MPWLDAVLAYLHFIAVFVLFAFLSIELVILKMDLDLRLVRLLGRMDVWYFGSAMTALVTGFLRLGIGAKGATFYTTGWPLYGKILLFIIVAVMSIYPTLAFIRWRRTLEVEPEARVPEAERQRMRRFVLVELHLAALIPFMAVMMSRGLR